MGNKTCCTCDQNINIGVQVDESGRKILRYKKSKKKSIRSPKKSPTVVKGRPIEDLDV